MARGRMLNKSISRDKAVAEICTEVGCEGGLFFTWLIPHLDRDGRIDGDPDVLKGMVAPRVPQITNDTVAATLKAAHERGLVIWYEANGDRYVCFPKFRKNQIGLRVDREPESEFPPPPAELDDAGKLPDDCRQSAGSLPDDCRQSAGSLPDDCRKVAGLSKEKGSKEKGSIREVEEKVSEEKKDLSVSKTETDRDRSSAPDEIPDGQLKPTDHPKAVPKPIFEVFAHYRQYHPKAHRKPQSGGKEWRLIRARLDEGYTVEDLCKAIDGCHRTPHNLGHNDRGTKYLSLGLIMRDGSQVNRFMGNADDPTLARNLSSKTRATATALSAWAERGTR